MPQGSAEGNKGNNFFCSDTGQPQYPGLKRLVCLHPLSVSYTHLESRLEFAHPWPQPVIDGEIGNPSFCLVNALELLDQPGEWYQDYPSGRIYYYPRPHMICSFLPENRERER